MTDIRRFGANVAFLAALWLREWQASLPDTLRAAVRVSRLKRLVIRHNQDWVVISLFGPEDEEIFVERIKWEDYSRDILDRCLKKADLHEPKGKVLLTLSVSHAMTQSLIIPRQARAWSENLVRENISRKTPLNPEDLFIGYDLRPAGSGKLELRYLALPQIVLDQLLARVSISRSELATLESLPIDGLPSLSVPLVQHLRAPTPWFKRAVAGLALISILAVLVGYCALAWRQASLLSDMETQISKISTSAKQSTEGLRSVAGLADDTARFTELRSAPGIVQVWEELARILPDSTFLTEMEVKGDDLHATGFSAAAPGLIQLLEKSSIVHGAAFSGPLVFDRAKGKEHFSLRATLRKARAPAEGSK